MAFPNPVRLFPRILRTILLLTAFCCAAVNAQDLVIQPTPFTALLDFAVLRTPGLPQPALPIWLESVQIIPAETVSETFTNPMGLPETKATPHTVIRIRLRTLQGFSDQTLLRLFFDDRPDARPSVTAWSETGECKFTSNPLGAGLDLPVSETLSIPTAGANYIEIDVPGNGTNLRKAFLSPLRETTVNAAFDFAALPPKAPPLADPFGNPVTQPASENDTYLFGRVRATLEPGVVKLEQPAATTGTETETTGTVPAKTSSVSFEFNLESAPLVGFVTLEILNSDLLAPVQAWVNDQPLGPVIPRYPDLADPAYRGIQGLLEPMRFRYEGWLQAQVIIPGSALKPGVNSITLQLPAQAGPVAIRAIELQLKHNWRSLDYTFAQ